MPLKLQNGRQGNDCFFDVFEGSLIRLWVTKSVSKTQLSKCGSKSTHSTGSLLGAGIRFESF